MKTVKIFLVICFAVLGTISCGSQNKERSEYELLPVPHIDHLERGDAASEKYKDKDGKPVSGFIDRDGHLIINLQFDYADEFSNGLARVSVNHKFGYINTKGEFIIKPQFDYAENFDKNDSPLALVRVGNKYGYIDKLGNYAINPQFEQADRFSYVTDEGMDKLGRLARVKVGDNWGFIDKSANYVIAPQFNLAMPFSEGRAGVKVNDKCGYIDGSGKMLVEPQFDCAVSPSYLGLDGQLETIAGTGDFSGHLAPVRINEKSTQTKPPTQANLPPIIMSDNTVGKSKYGYIDRMGKRVIEPQFDVATNFSNGLAVVGFTQNFTKLVWIEGQKGESKWENRPVTITKLGFINETGRIVISPTFDHAKNFSGGLAAVGFGGTHEQYNSSCGYIDTTGKYVIEPKFSECGSFSNGVAYVKVRGNINIMNTKILIIDKSGKIIFTYYSPNTDTEHLF